MKSKKWLAFLASAVMLVPVAVAGCNNGGEGEGNGGGNNPPANALAAPEVTLNGNILSWPAVDNADSYSVYLKENGKNTVVSEKQEGLTYYIPKDVAGDYEYYVIAHDSAKDIKSGRSVTVTYTLAPDASTKLAGTVYLVGDSTVCDFNDSYYLPRKGYGTQLYNYLNCDAAQIRNLAMSGKSSLSFISQGNYNTLKSSLKQGDYLIVGFGHNDEKKEDPARYTDPNGSTNTKGSFKYTLNEYYLKLAAEKGATPILCTPIVRYDASGSYTGAKVHVTANGDYVKAIKDLGIETNTTVIDLTALTKEIYKNDNEAAKYFHAHLDYEGFKPNESPASDSRDDTHINAYGAKTVAYRLAQALLASDCSIKAHVKTNALAPYFDIDYPQAINALYTKTEYSAFDPDTTTAEKIATTTNATVADWYASAMGALGGDSVSPFTMTYTDGTFTVGNASGSKGKFSPTGDGFAAAFIQIDAGKNFTASATVTVKSCADANEQSAFGMMLRDDILINRRKDTLTSNYIAAGILNTKGSVFTRVGGTLNPVSFNNTTAVKAGDTYDIEIKRVGTNIVVKFGVNSMSYDDFDLIVVDHDYMYLCLFATRNIIAEFTNVQFEITGNAEGA